MTTREYTIKVTKQNKNGIARAWLLEDGSQIAHVTREANIDNICMPIKFKWFSERARDRFCGHCDSISMAEGVEALGFPAPFAH